MYHIIMALVHLSWQSVEDKEHGGAQERGASPAATPLGHRQPAESGCLLTSPGAQEGNGQCLTPSHVPLPEREI